MREHLFRGIRVDNGELVEGCYVKTQKLNGDGYEYFIIKGCSEDEAKKAIISTMWSL